MWKWESITKLKCHCLQASVLWESRYGARTECLLLEKVPDNDSKRTRRLRRCLVVSWGPPPSIGILTANDHLLAPLDVVDERRDEAQSTPRRLFAGDSMEVFRTIPKVRRKGSESGRNRIYICMYLQRHATVWIYVAVGCHRWNMVAL